MRTRLYKATARIVARALAIGIIVPLFALLGLITGIRITPMATKHIGAISTPLLHYLGQKRRGMISSRQLFLGADPCNRQLFDMLKREITVIENRVLWVFYQYTSDILHRLTVFRPLPSEKEGNYANSRYKTSNNTTPLLTFTDEEERRGRALLESMGIGENDWFVCFQARDSAYRATLTDSEQPYRHRNAPLETYLPAAKHISNLGGFALRMGHIPGVQMPETHNPKIINYAEDFRSDFGDIYLLSKARFFLSSSSGLQMVCPLVGTPVATAHMTPLLPNSTGQDSLYTPKLLKSKTTGEFASIREFFAVTGVPKDSSQGAGVDLIDNYENNRYTLVDNSADDVMLLCQDMLDKLNGVKPEPDALDYQKKYHDKFFGHAKDVHTFGPRISPRFALKHRHLIDAD